MCILNGPTASGKTSLVRALAQMTGHTLHEFAMNSSVDTTEILGKRGHGEEQKGEVADPADTHI